MISFVWMGRRVFNPWVCADTGLECDPEIKYGFERWVIDGCECLSLVSHGVLMVLTTECADGECLSVIAEADLDGRRTYWHQLYAQEEVAEVLRRQYEISWGEGHGARVPVICTGETLYSGLGLSARDLGCIEVLDVGGRWMGDFERDFHIQRLS